MAAVAGHVDDLVAGCGVFQAVQVTSVRKAFSLFYKGHVRAVLPDYSTYEFENWCDIPPQPQDEVVFTPSMAIRIPRVVALKDYDRLPRQYVDEHEEIITAIEAGDVDRCDKLAAKHASQIVRQIQDYITRDLQRPLDFAAA